MNPGDSRNPGPSGLAITTLVLALVGIFTGGLASVVALITGVVEHVRIRRGKSSRGGYGMNLVGLWLAAAMVVVLLVLGTFIAWLTGMMSGLVTGG